MCTTANVKEFVGFSRQQQNPDQEAEQNREWANKEWLNQFAESAKKKEQQAKPKGLPSKFVMTVVMWSGKML